MACKTILKKIKNNCTFFRYMFGNLKVSAIFVLPKGTRRFCQIY